MNRQLGDPEHKALRDIRIAAAQKAAHTARPYVTRSTDGYEVVRRRRLEGARTLSTVVAGCAIFTVGTVCSIWFFGGYDMLAELVKGVLR